MLTLAMSEGDVKPHGAPMVVAEAKNIGKWEYSLARPPDQHCHEEALLILEPRYIPCP